MNVESINLSQEIEPVFNLQVEKGHTYFVLLPGSDVAVLVHNSSRFDFLAGHSGSQDNFVSNRTVQDIGNGRVRVRLKIIFRSYSFLANDFVESQVVDQTFELTKEQYDRERFGALLDEKTADLNNILYSQGQVKAKEQALEVYKQAAILALDRWRGPAFTGGPCQFYCHYC